MLRKTNNLYEFGEFRLDVDERVLYRKGQLLVLAPKVFDTLRCFVERNGKIVSKEELMNDIWEDSFVEESNLTQNIYTLRQIFGKRNKFIETVPRRGYRFTAEVRVVENGLPSERASRDLAEIVVSRRTTATLLREEIIEEDGDDVYLIQKTRILPEPDSESRSFFRSRRFQLGLALGILAVIVIGTSGFFVWQRALAPASNTLLENISFSALTDTGDVRHIAISPDAQFLALIKSDSNKIWLKDINSKQDVALNLAQTLNPQSIAFSPDGNSIYFLNRKNAGGGAEIYKTTRFGGNAEFVAGNVWSEFSFSIDGGRIAFFRQVAEENRHQLVVANLNERLESVLLTKDFPEGFDLRSSPVWSRDGKDIYAISKPQEKPNSTLLRVEVATGKEETIPSPQIRQFVAVSVLPSSELIFTAREQNKFPQIYKMAASGGAVQRVTNDLNLYRKISVSGDGKSLVALQRNNASHLWTVPDLKPENARQLTFGRNNRDARQGLDVLPDGRIVYTSLEDLNRDLWIIDPADNSKQQLTVKQNEVNERPFVTKDGESIFFSSLDNQTFNLSQIRPNGQDQKRITFDNSANDLYPNVSADNSTLYFIRKAKGKSSIVKKSLSDGQELEVALLEGFSPDSNLALSPDGEFLAFRQTDLERRNDGEDEASNLVKVCVISTENNLSKAATVSIMTSNSQFQWSESSDAIYFVNHTPEMSAIWKQRLFEDSEPTKIIELRHTRIYNFKFINENGLVVSQGKSMDDVILLKNF